MTFLKEQNHRDSKKIKGSGGGRGGREGFTQGAPELDLER